MTKREREREIGEGEKGKEEGGREREGEKEKREGGRESRKKREGEADVG